MQPGAPAGHRLALEHGHLAPGAGEAQRADSPASPAPTTTTWSVRPVTVRGVTRPTLGRPAQLGEARVPTRGALERTGRSVCPRRATCRVGRVARQRSQRRLPGRRRAPARVSARRRRRRRRGSGHRDGVGTTSTASRHRLARLSRGRRERPRRPPRQERRRPARCRAGDHPDRVVHPGDRRGERSAASPIDAWRRSARGLRAEGAPERTAPIDERGDAHVDPQHGRERRLAEQPATARCQVTLTAAVDRNRALDAAAITSQSRVSAGSTGRRLSTHSGDAGRADDDRGAASAPDASSVSANAAGVSFTAVARPIEHAGRAWAASRRGRGRRCRGRRAPGRPGRTLRTSVHRRLQQQRLPRAERSRRRGRPGCIGRGAGANARCDAARPRRGR